MVPTTPAVKVTLMIQLAEAAKVEALTGHVVVSAKGVMAARLEIVSAPLPVFVSVTV